MSRVDRLRLAFAGLHPDRVRALVESYGSPGRVCRAIASGRIDVPEPAARAVAEPAERLSAAVAAAGASVVCHGDPAYPRHLADLPDAPDVLFVRGGLPEEPMVAIVGTRRCSRYGRELASAYGRAVAAAGWPVVSGLARGIDGAAHRGVVRAGGVGVAVLGSGLDVVYPAEHRGLHDELLAGGGGVVTEYPPGTPPQGWRFPPRNRIISGLTAAVVVVEAGEKGGALITAAAALAHDRVVMAVPGDVDRPTSRGCNLLIRDGAVPVLDPADLVEALSLLPWLQPPAARVATPPDPVVAAIGPAGTTIDDIAEVLGRPVSDVAAEVGRLEVAGWVRRDGEVIVRDL